MTNLITTITNLISTITHKAKNAASLILTLCFLFNISAESFAQAYTFKPSEEHSKSVESALIRVKNEAAAKTIPGALTFEQAKALIHADLLRVGVQNTLEEEDYQSLYNEYLQNIAADEAQVAAVYNILKEERSLSFIWDGYPNQSATVCEDKQCFERANYMHGALRVILLNSIGADNKHKEFRWNKEILLANVKSVYDIISEYSVSLKDRPLVRKYLTTLVKEGSGYCDNDIYTADIVPGFAGTAGQADARQGKENRRKECENLGYAVITLGMLEGTITEKEQAADNIHKLLQDTYKEDYGAIMLANAITALMLNGGQKSYAYIEDFLLKESLSDGLRKGNLWQVLGRVLDVISIKAWVDNATNVNNRLRGRGGRYLNNAGLRYQYIDEEAARAMGISDFKVQSFKSNPALAYNIPYGNILEDLGQALASSQDNYARKIVDKIVRTYFNDITAYGSAYGSVHTPLVIGALKSGKINTYEAKAVARKINTLDWWDLNEATQRRINNSVTNKGLGYFQVKTQDDVKTARADRNTKIGELAVWGDMAIAAISLTALIVSLPALVRGALSAANTLGRVRNIQAAGKLKLLKTVKTRIKASGVNPKQIKVNNYNKTVAKAEQLTPKTVVKPTKPAQAQNTKPVEGFVAEELSPNMAKVKFKWQLQQPKTKVTVNNTTLTAQIGEGSGGGVSAAKTSAPAKDLQYSFKPAEGFTPKPYTPKPLKVVDNARFKKAVFQANVDHFFGTARQIVKSAKGKLGATILSVNLSLANPVMLNAAESGKAFALIENIAGTEAALTTGRTIKTAGTVRAATPVISNIAKITPAPKLTPIKISANNNLFSVPYFGINTAIVLPKYGYTKEHSILNPIGWVHKSKGTDAIGMFPYTLQTKDEASILTDQNRVKFATTAHTGTPLTENNAPQILAGQTDPILPLALLYASFNKFLKPTIKNTNFKAIIPESGFFGSSFKAPQGSDKKKGVETFYVNEAGDEVKLPLTFNIDKAIKVTNKQRGVFNADNRLEIRNGGKKPTEIEGFSMLLENTPEAKLSFLSEIKVAALKNPFTLKVQFGQKTPKHLKETAIRTAVGEILPIKILIDKKMLGDDEALRLTQDGTLTAVNVKGVPRELADANLRIPKEQIENLIAVLKNAQNNYVFDIVPTQNKVIPFMLSFLTATTIMAMAPAFKEIFDLSEFWANTIMGVISFGPAAVTPFSGYFFKKYGVSNLMKAATAMAFAGVAMAAVSGFYGYSSGSSILGLVGATLGLSFLSLSNEMKFSAMSPLIEVNFEKSKALAVTSKSLMARSLGTILFLQFPPLYNAIMGALNLPKADDTIAFALLLVPLAGLATAKMLPAKLREVPAMPENDITAKSLAKIFATNKDIRNGAIAFTMFESFEATLSLLVFSIAKEYYGALSSLPNIIGGVAIYAAMVLGRYMASYLQKEGILDASKTYLASAIASIGGTIAFAALGATIPGLLGAATAFIGTSNFFAPLYSATSERNPGKSSEISLIFFTTTTLALLSTVLLGGVIDFAGGPVPAAFAVPMISLLTGLYVSKYVFKDLKMAKKIEKKLQDLKKQHKK